MHHAQRVSALAAGRGDNAAALVFEYIGFYRRLGYTGTGARHRITRGSPVTIIYI
jgi:hypothetical protein